MPVEISLVSEKVRPQEDEDEIGASDLQLVSPGDVITRFKNGSQFLKRKFRILFFFSHFSNKTASMDE